MRRSSTYSADGAVRPELPIAIAERASPRSSGTPWILLKMNYRGSYRKLLENSQAATIAAIEIYNKPMFHYRDECTTILLLNAWELVLKALLSKNKKSVFYPKKRDQRYKTLTWQDAMSKGAEYFPSAVPHLPVRRNLDLLSSYRDNAVHFYNAKDFGVVLYALSQTSIMNYRDLLHHSFAIDMEDKVNWKLLPIGIRPPIDAVSYIAGTSDAKMTTAVRQFLSELARSTKEIAESNEDTGRLLTIFSVKLESIKKIGEADVVVAIDNDATQSGPLTIVRTQDPNKSHPLRQSDVVQRIGELHGTRFTSYVFQAIVWKHGLKERPQYCWMSSEGVLIKYSNDTVTWIKRLPEADVNECLDEYRGYIRLRAKKTVSKP